MATPPLRARAASRRLAAIRDAIEPPLAAAGDGAPNSCAIAVPACWFVSGGGAFRGGGSGSGLASHFGEFGARRAAAADAPGAAAAAARVAGRRHGTARCGATAELAAERRGARARHAAAATTAAAAAAAEAADTAAGAAEIVRGLLGLRRVGEALAARRRPPRPLPRASLPPPAARAPPATRVRAPRAPHWSVARRARRVLSRAVVRRLHGGRRRVRRHGDTPPRRRPPR